MTKVIELNFEQGSPEWLANRRTTFNASELAAAMNIHPNIGRNDLLRVYATGTEIEYSDYVKNVIFPNGHRVEQIIRPIVERELADDFIPKVFVLDGKYSCSLDGQNIIGDTNLEIKQYEKDLYESVYNGILPDHHKPQVQQGLWITGAERAVFAVSSEDEQSFAHVIVEPDPEFFDTIPRIWEKFAEDVENYTDIEQVSFLSEVEKDNRLPVVKLSSGGISVASNIKTWFSVKKQAFEKLPATINADTIGEFQTTKDNFEEALPLIQHLRKGLEENAKPLVDVIAELVSIEKYLKKGVSHCTNTLTEFRRSIRQEACDKATADFFAYVAEKNQALPIQIYIQTPDFMACCNRTKNHDSLSSAIGAELANSKITVDKIAEDLCKKHAWYIANSEGYSHLFEDLQEIIYRDDEHFKLTITSRIEQHKKAEEVAKANAVVNVGQDQKLEEQPTNPIPEFPHPVAPEQANQGEIARHIDIIPKKSGSTVEIEKSAPTLKLGEINDRFGFVVTVEFLKSIGFEPHCEGSKKLFHESDFPRICSAISNRMTDLISKFG